MEQNIDTAPEQNRIERKATGIRILLTLLFVLVSRVVEAVLTVVVLIELIATLVTQQPPGQSLRRFANQTVAYMYRILRYLTYNDAEPPFPFTDFPDEFEPPTDAYDAPVDALAESVKSA